MTDYAVEPAIPTRVALETPAGDEWQPHEATIANLTRHEVWVGIDESLGELLYPERRVRLVLSHKDGGTQTAETMVLWHIGLDGKVIVLMRPSLWDPPSKRAHSRTRLTIPVYLSADGGVPSVPAMTTNIGVGGVYCLTDVRIPVAQTLPISIRLTPDDSFDCQAEVVRVDEDTDDPTGKQVVIAMRLLSLGENDQAKLATSLVALADDVDADGVPGVWRNASAVAEADA